jgi:hypothetical protein
VARRLRRRGVPLLVGLVLVHPLVTAGASVVPSDGVAVSSPTRPPPLLPNRNRPCPEGQHHATQVMYRDADGNGRFRRDTDTGLARRSAGCMVFHPAHDHWHFEVSPALRPLLEVLPAGHLGRLGRRLPVLPGRAGDAAQAGYG